MLLLGLQETYTERAKTDPVGKNFAFQADNRQAREAPYLQKTWPESSWTWAGICPIPTPETALQPHSEYTRLSQPGPQPSFLLNPGLTAKRHAACPGPSSRFLWQACSWVFGGFRGPWLWHALGPVPRATNTDTQPPSPGLPICPSHTWR